MKTLQARNMAKSGQAGFTIIELIVVILLLGILTATALPRFLDVTDEAHAAVVDAVQGGLVTGGALFRAQFVAGGEDTASAVTEFGSNYPSANGYPIGTGTGLTTNADCVNAYTGLLQEGRPSVEAAAGATAAAINATDLSSATAGVDFVAKLNGGSCTFAYVGQFAATADGTIPTLTFDTSDGSVTASSL